MPEHVGHDNGVGRGIHKLMWVRRMPRANIEDIVVVAIGPTAAICRAEMTI